MKLRGGVLAAQARNPALDCWFSLSPSHVCEIPSPSHPSTADEAWYWPKCVLRSGYFTYHLGLFFFFGLAIVHTLPILLLPRLYGTKCAGCNVGLCPEDLVRRAVNKVYHVHCFLCSLCKKTLSTGEQLYLVQVRYEGGMKHAPPAAPQKK